LFADPDTTCHRVCQGRGQLSVFKSLWFRHEKEREHLPGLESTMCRKVRQKGKNTFWKFLIYSFEVLT
jgi:hypothetical protein